MNVNPISALSGMTAAPSAVQTPRTVSPESNRQFRELMSADVAPCGRPDTPCPAQPPAKSGLNEALDFSIEKILMANMPAAHASPAEFAIGLLRAQVKVSQAAIAIETVSKTTQSLSQGVQSLTARS